MYHFNDMPEYGHSLEDPDAEILSDAGTDRVAAILALRENSNPTPLHSLPHLARRLGLASLHVKDEGFRLGLGSFKALGGAYAVMILVMEEASRRLGRVITPVDLASDEVRTIARDMTFACATDGNHGRSVAQGARLVGAMAVIFVHAGVSVQRIDSIAQFGARIARVEGNYDESVAEASRVASVQGWTVVSDTSWPGYEHIPGLVMQGYTVMVREVLAALPQPPTHVLLQAGVGGFAASIAGHMVLRLTDKRPHITVVEPARAACLVESAKAGHPVKVPGRGSTVMAMLECYEPSLIAFRILKRVADGFMTVEEEAAPEAMRLLADPAEDDPAIVAGESGGVGLAGLLTALRDPTLAARIGLTPGARVLIFNTEGATDPVLYADLVGRSPETVFRGATL
jgi:diaminopropionate ammonia-lyase